MARIMHHPMLFALVFTNALPPTVHAPLPNVLAFVSTYAQ